MRLDGKVALVTGATSGIGTAIARSFANAGAAVILTGRGVARGEAVLETIRLGGGKAAFVAGDVAERAFCDAIVAATIERFGTIDILVNNAGIAYRRTAETTTDDEWRQTMAVNVHAVFYLSRAALGVMQAKRSGVIVNIASDAGVVGAPKLAAYCASKGAIIQFTRAAALDHARDGIRVNAICPTNVDTPMIEGEARQLGVDLETYRRESADYVPMGRVGTADEVADMALFLASDRARFVTGAALALDGGSTAA